MEMEQREVEEAQAASARWPAQPNVTTQIETMTRQMHISEVPMNIHEELERVFPSGEEDAGTQEFAPASSGWAYLQTTGHLLHPSSFSCCWWREREISLSQYGDAGTDTSSGPEPCDAAAREPGIHDARAHQT